MRRLIIASMILAITLLPGLLFSPSLAQTPPSDDTPTFYHLVPGTYVNGWPRFTIHYPKDWAEVRHRPDQVFMASAPGSADDPCVAILVVPSSHPLDKVVDQYATLFRTIGTDVTLVSDKPSHLRDGTQAQEIEFQFVANGALTNWLSLATRKSTILIDVGIRSFKGKIREDLKAIPYSLELDPGFDEPVKVPRDILDFLDEYRSAILSGDATKVLAYYSDGYLLSGVRKGEQEQMWRQFRGPVTSFEVGITDFVAAGERAYLAGFAVVNGRRWPLAQTSAVKENGHWRWYGNQRDTTP